MKIDNRLLIPLVAPWGLWAFVRVFWAATGAEWGDPTAAAGFCFMVGVVMGTGASVVLFAEDISLGSFYIGRRRDD